MYRCSILNPCLLSPLNQDTQSIADGLAEVSHGKILTGVYHSEVSDKEKENLHKAWRSGTVKVVCATIGERPLFWAKYRLERLTISIAFGLGIDKADVRFVLHHSVCAFPRFVRAPPIHFSIDVEIVGWILPRVWPCRAGW